MSSFSTGMMDLDAVEAPEPGPVSHRPRAKLQHLRNYRFREELEPDKLGTPQVVRTKGMDWLTWRRCAGSEWYELE